MLFPIFSRSLSTSVTPSNSEKLFLSYYRAATERLAAFFGFTVLKVLAVTSQIPTKVSSTKESFLLS